MQGSINFDGSLVGNITGGGGGGSEVVITPVLTSGTKIADVTVDGEDKDLFAPTPTPPTPATEVSVTQTLSSGTKIGSIEVDGESTDLFAPTPTPPTPATEVNVTQVLASGTKIATINVNGVDYDIYSTDYSEDISSLQIGLSTANSNITALQGRMTTAEGNITTLQSDMTAAEGDISTLQSGLSTANSNITALQGRVTTAEENITTLQSDMSAAESIIGDGQLDIGNDLTDAVNEINQSLSDLGGNGYTAPSSFDPHVSHVSGGYCKIGKIVIVNLRISASQTISAGALLVNGLPTPNSTQNIVSVTNNRKADMTLNSQGSIGTADQLSSGNIILSCVYVCS